MTARSVRFMQESSMTSCRIVCHPAIKNDLARSCEAWRRCQRFGVLPFVVGFEYSLSVKGIPGTIQEGGADFATTHWTVIEACAKDDVNANSAMARLCQSNSVQDQNFFAMPQFFSFATR